jgi:hypothetical protein
VRRGGVYDDSAHNSDEDAAADDDGEDGGDGGDDDDDNDGGDDDEGDDDGGRGGGGRGGGGDETPSGCCADDEADGELEVPATKTTTTGDGGGGSGWVYSFNVGVEAEAAGRQPTKSFQELRRDLAALPWVLAGSDDVVLAPQQRPEFLDSLRAAGVTNLPEFEPQLSRERRDTVEGYRPYGVAGSHLRRSAVVRYRDDVTVCHTLDQVRAAVVLHGYHGGGGGGGGTGSNNGKVVLKSEFSSSGLGVRVYTLDTTSSTASPPPPPPPPVAEQPTTPSILEDGSADERWVTNCLRRDGSLTVEPWYDMAAEVTGEWLDGRWVGVSQCIVRDMRWEGQWLGDDPVEGGMDPGVADFVFGERREGHGGGVERALAALRVPETCGAATCGVDVAIVREEHAGGGGGGAGVAEVEDKEDTDASVGGRGAGRSTTPRRFRYRARVMELNARTTMSHYALAARRRLAPSSPTRAPRRFVVVRLSELGTLGGDVVCLTDPKTATAFVACVVF